MASEAWTPALARALMQGCRLGPASESLQGRKPRVGEALAAKGAALWRFGDRRSGGGWHWRRVFASCESGGSVRDWRVNVEWRFGGAEGCEIGRALWGAAAGAPFDVRNTRSTRHSFL
jgi:hypothetical protein